MWKLYRYSLAIIVIAISYNLIKSPSIQFEVSVDTQIIISSCMLNKNLSTKIRTMILSIPNCTTLNRVILLKSTFKTISCMIHINVFRHQRWRKFHFHQISYKMTSLLWFYNIVWDIQMNPVLEMYIKSSVIWSLFLMFKFYLFIFSIFYLFVLFL